MNSQKFNRQSAAKTLHKPLRGFEYRYIIYETGFVYDRFTNNLVKETNGTITIFGSNNKPYKIKIQKLLDNTFSDIDFSDYVELKAHKGYIINKNGSLYNTASKKFIGTTIKNKYIRYNVDWNRRMMHEVLADQFIPNPNNYNSIDHLDCNKLNNSLDNLEWCDIEENKRRAYNNGLTAVVKTLVTFIKDDESFSILGLESASKIFSIKKSTLCTLIKRYGDKDLIIPSGSMKGYKIITQKVKCKVQRLSEMEQGSSELEMINISNRDKDIV